MKISALLLLLTFTTERSALFRMKLSKIKNIHIFPILISDPLIDPFRGGDPVVARLRVPDYLLTFKRGI